MKICKTPGWKEAAGSSTPKKEDFLSALPTDPKTPCTDKVEARKPRPLRHPCGTQRRKKKNFKTVSQHVSRLKTSLPLYIYFSNHTVLSLSLCLSQAIYLFPSISLPSLLYQSIFPLISLSRSIYRYRNVCPSGLLACGPRRKEKTRRRKEKKKREENIPGDTCRE